MLNYREKKIILTGKKMENNVQFQHALTKFGLRLGKKGR